MSRSPARAVKGERSPRRLRFGRKSRERWFPGGAGHPRGNVRSGGRYGTSFSSLLGEPLPTLLRTPEVAPLTRAEATAAGPAEGWPDR